MRRLLVACLLAAAAAAAPGPAAACGAMVSTDGQVELNSFQALLSYHDQREDMVVSIRYAGSPEGFAWLMPLPSAPEVTESRQEALDAAASLTAPPVLPSRSLFGGAAAPPAGGAAELGQTIVGDLELVTLRASSLAGLESWTSAHGFRLLDRQGPTLATYLQRGWVIVAARLTREVAASGDSITVRFRFSTPALTYPLALAGANHPGQLTGIFYVVAPYRTQVTSLPQVVVRPDMEGYFPTPGSTLQLRYAAPLGDASADERTIRSAVQVPRGAWLNMYEGSWTLDQLRSDLALARSRTQAPLDYSALRAEEDRANFEDDALLAFLALQLVAVAAGLVTGLVLVALRLRA